MGFPGSTSFLNHHQAITIINVSAVLEEYIRNNPNERPLIVFDFANFCNGILGKYQSEFIYGGRHFQMQQYFRSIMEKFSGCKLVFFTDCNMQDVKKNEWMRRQDENFQRYQNLYTEIGEYITPNRLQRINHDMALRSVCFEMERLAPEFGEFHYLYKRESDVEIARYATENRAMAVISSDSDFIIFPGQWKLWAGELCLNNSGAIITKEFDRNAFRNGVSLPYGRKLSLFATLLGNDFTKRFSTHLGDKFGYGLQSKFNVANYVRNLNSDLDFVRITQYVFGQTNREFENLLRQSLNFYDINSPIHIPIDPVADQLIGNAIYPTYLMIMGKVQCISMGYYDLHQDRDVNRNLPTVLIEWMRRKVGILRQHIEDSTYTFSVLAKMDRSQNFREYRATPVSPPMAIPPLVRLYLGNGRDNDPELDSIRFRILGWIMSLPDQIIARIRKFSVWQRIKTVALYALVKERYITLQQADGIFYAEKKAHDRNFRNVDEPTHFLRGNIRAIHIYNIVFTHVRQNVAIAGLLQDPNFDVTETILQFDGLYFHSLMERIVRMTPREYQNFLVPFEEFRIYADFSNNQN